MSDAEHTNLISEFMKITGVDSNHARTMLEAYEWNYDAAVSGYFDTFEEEHGANMKSLVSEKDEAKPPLEDPRLSCKKPRSYEFPGATNIATLASLTTGEHDHSSSSNSDDEEGQAFYAGGSVHSGQQVLGPSKKSKAGSGIVKEMFESAVSHGAEVLNPSDSHPVASQVLAFRGIGHVLGSSAKDSVAVSGEAEQLSDHPLEVCLKAWRNGFSIDDGPLRDYNDPVNKAFLDDVRRGEVPQELMRRMLSAQGQQQRTGAGEIHLSLEDHGSEDYKPLKQTLQAFSGAGHRLGSPTPSLTFIAKSLGDSLDNEQEAEKSLNLDENKPVTVVQIRLTDGSRLKIRVNHGHTVNDIRRYIVLARPEYSSAVFALMNSNSYPMKEITDDNLTIEEANLLNSVLVQRIK